MKEKETQGNEQSILGGGKIWLLLAALAGITLGLIMIIKANEFLGVINYVMGAVLALYGVVMVAQAFRKTESSTFTGLVPGVLALGIGLSFFIQPDKVKSILWIFIGLVILVDAVYKLERAFSQKARGAALWWISLLTAFITLILAGLLMFLQITDEHFMTILSGAFLLANGVFDLAEFVLLIVAAKLAEKKSVVVVEEVDVTEVTDVTDPAEAAVTTDATDVQE